MGDEEKTEDLAGEVVEEEVDKQENPPKQRQRRPDRKMSVIKQETIARRKKVALSSIEKEIGRLKTCLEKSRSEMKKMDENISVRQQHMRKLENISKKEIYNTEELLRGTEEKKADDARTIFEEESKYNPERNATIKKLTDEMVNRKSERDKVEHLLNNYKRYKKIQSQAESFQAQVPSHRDVQDEQSREPQESQVRQGLESSPDGGLSSPRESTLSSARNNTLDKNSKVDGDSGEYEEKPVLYISDPQKLLDLSKELTQQIMSLFQNSTRDDEIQEEFQQTIDTAMKKMKEEEEKLISRENDMTERRDIQLGNSASLSKKVQIHDALKTEDKDVLLDALSMKVTEVHVRCVDSRLSYLNTLEKLTRVEYFTSSVLQLVESIPEDFLEKQRQIKDKERRNRLLEEKRRQEEREREERRKKCLARSHGDTKKTTGRKLMPRCIHVKKQEVQVCDEGNIEEEDDLYDNPWGIEDSD